MPQSYTGNTTGLSGRPAATISEPLGSDVRNATSVVTPLRKLADLVQYLMSKVGMVDVVSTWTAKQTMAGGLDVSSGDVALIAAALQKLTKSGGKLQVGTSDGNDLELLRAGVIMLGLTASGIDFKNYTLVNLARILLQSVTVDPATPADGNLWFRSDMAKFRAQIAGLTQNLATESQLADVCIMAGPVVGGGPFNFAAGTSGRLSTMGYPYNYDPAATLRPRGASSRLVQDAATNHVRLRVTQAGLYRFFFKTTVAATGGVAGTIYTATPQMYVNNVGAANETFVAEQRYHRSGTDTTGGVIGATCLVQCNAGDVFEPGVAGSSGVTDWRWLGSSSTTVGGEFLGP